MRRFNFSVKMRVFLASVLMLCTLGVIFACSDSESQNHYAFEGLSDVHVSVNATEYDFTTGVKALDNLAETEFTFDASAVAFGQAGEYSVQYTVGDYTQARKVYIYGTPQLSVVSAEIDYATAISANALAGAVKAVDTFGNELTAVVEKGIEPGAGGYVEYGKYEVSFSATDRVGNRAELTCELTVSDKNAPEISAMEIDLADVGQPIPVDADAISHLFVVEGQELTELKPEDYTFVNGYLVFSTDFIVYKDLATYTLKFVTSTGYCDVPLTIKDEKPANFQFDVYDMDYAETITFDTAALIGYQRNIDFVYTVEDEFGDKYDVTVEEDKVSFAPGMAQAFTITAQAKRGDVDAGSKTCEIAVHDDVYAWTVEPDDVYDEVYFWGEHRAEYDASKSYGDYNGSLHLTASGSRQDVSVIFLGATNVPVRSSFYFYVYNPTGIELKSEMYTSNGYWATIAGVNGVLTEPVTIPADEGWHKVTLTLKREFDGTLGTFSGGPGDISYTEIRVMAADGQTSPNGSFNVWMSNIYLATERGNLVDYNDENFVGNALLNTLVSLPAATAEDGRIHFEYTLVNDGEKDVAFNKKNMTFTPDAAGEYTFTVQAYFRDTKIAENSYTITVADVILPVQDVYWYGADKTVTLPEAQPEPSGNVEYYVKDQNSEKTVLDAETRTFSVPDVGDYVYGVSIDGRTIEEEIKLRDERIILDGTQVVDWPNRNLNTVTYTTEIAAPGENGAIKLDKTDWPQLGERALGLDGQAKNINGHAHMIFWIYVGEKSTTPFTVQLYTDKGNAFNFTVNGVRYGKADEAADTGYVDNATNPFAGKWSKVVIDLTDENGNPLTGDGWMFLRITTNGYTGYLWEGEPVTYISSLYFDDAPVTEPEYSFTGLDDVRIKQDAESYDFNSGVTAYKSGEETAFTADASGVVFGTPGQYTVTYKVDEYTQQRNVFIYGTPEFTLKTPEIEYAVACSNELLANAVTATDTFGEPLTVTVTTGIPVGEEGYIEYGEYTVKFSATDIVGNSGEYECEVTVTRQNAPTCDEIFIQAEQTEITVDFVAESITKILLLNDGGNVTLDPEGDYSFADNKLTLTDNFVGLLEPGTSEELRIVTPYGYCEVVVTKTEVQPVEFTFTVSDVDYTEKVLFAPAVPSIPGEQDVTFEYTVKDDAGKSYPVTTESDGKLSFMPGTSVSFEITALAQRGGLDAGSKTCKLSLHDDVVAWTVEPDNNYEDISFWDYNTAAYDAESFDGVHNGSLRMESTTEKGVIGSGKVGYKAVNWGTVPNNATLYFYINNSTGVELKSLIFTNNGYWEAQQGGILSDTATISAQPGWQKVTLQLRFDGNFDALISDSDKYTELRIYAEGEIYNGEAPFAVKVSNLYLQVDRGADLVSYNEEGFNSVVKLGTPGGLPSASSTDARVRFEYTLQTEGGEPVSFDEESFTFTPAAAGKYNFTVKSYFRDALIAEKTYTVTATALLLAADAQYTFDQTRTVTLPKADTSMYEGKTVAYTLTDSSGRVLNPSDTEANTFTEVDTGDYIYKVTVSDGATVVDSLQVSVKLRDSRIVFDCSAFEGEPVEGTAGAVFSRDSTLTLTTEKAAPGESKSLKVYRDDEHPGERIIQLENVKDAINGKSKLVFWMYVDETSTTPFTVQFYADGFDAANGRFNFTYDGTSYGKADEGTNSGFVTGAAGRWSKVVIDLTADGAPITVNSWAYLRIATNGWEQFGSYAWEGAPEIYLSSFYFE